ncbi:MAG TPA: potassium-transporting ATPase subunit B, partial [Thermoplasmata archaeon]|nr:potassium-transporting ATPase subunit B [Thermoplasmata archaeon]
MEAVSATPLPKHPRPKTSILRVVRGSFTLLAPEAMVRNPVMFVVYVFMFFTAAVTLVPSAFTDLTRHDFSRSYYLAITVILFFTLWFATLSESIAEAQGRAQAESLREIRSATPARKVGADGQKVRVSASTLHRGDVVAVDAGDVVPLDGDVIEGAVEIDESMMTGESAAVIRESGGDKTSVLGGSKVIQGSALVRIASDPGQSFLDRMIRL